VYPDASGNSRKTVDASKSDIALLREAGYSINAPAKNGAVKDRIIAVNTMFCNSIGTRRLFINTNVCKELVDNLNEQAYDDNGNPRKANNVDHMLDAIGYLVYRKYGLNKASSKVKTFRL
jgi:hypothetical protein